jgi:hypothetical protein
MRPFDLTNYVLSGEAGSRWRPYRAQLCVYLKLNDIPVPRLCGPSADEGDKDREFYQIRAVD